jgi:predicted  nucleic acid-binding Zn-ribbon protein
MECYDYEICYKCGEIYEDKEILPYCPECAPKQQEPLYA